VGHSVEVWLLGTASDLDPTAKTNMTLQSMRREQFSLLALSDVGVAGPLPESSSGNCESGGGSRGEF
jgi:hypothetical protein